MEQRAEQRLQSRLDQEHYQESELITLTIPLTLPYVSDTRGFERVDGEITLDGKIYHYVKRAIKNGAYVLLCLPDHGKMKLEHSKAEYSKLTSDFQQNQSSKKDDGKADLFKNIRVKYTQHCFDDIVFVIQTASVEAFSRYTPYTVDRQDALPDQPPEQAWHS